MLHKRGRFLGVSVSQKGAPFHSAGWLGRRRVNQQVLGGQYLEMRQMKQQKNVEEQTH